MPRLTEMEPRWIHPNVLAFKCPHCLKQWLCVNDGPVTMQELYDACEKEFGPDWNMMVVPCPEQPKWTFSSRDLNVISIFPSVDASLSGSGHWHGWVTDGTCN
jgi:hypothetical protein